MLRRLLQKLLLTLKLLQGRCTINEFKTSSEIVSILNTISAVILVIHDKANKAYSEAILVEREWSNALVNDDD